MQQSFDHCALELAYEKTLHQTNAICSEERGRHLRMQILLLEDENDQLQEQLAQAEDRVDELQQLGDEREVQLNDAHDSLDSAQSNLRLKTREIETLTVKRKLLPCQATSADYCLG